MSRHPLKTEVGLSIIPVQAADVENLEIILHSRCGNLVHSIAYSVYRMYQTVLWFSVLNTFKETVLVPSPYCLSTDFKRAKTVAVDNLCFLVTYIVTLLVFCGLHKYLMQRYTEMFVRNMG